MNIKDVVVDCSSLFGQQLQVEGKLFKKFWRCVLVPLDAPNTEEAWESGILVACPGLGAELPLTGYISASMVRSFVQRALIDGTLRKSTISPFPLMLTDITSVRLLTTLLPPYDVNLVGIDELREHEIRDLEQDPYLSDQQRQELLAEFRARRKEW